jgi:hypothetical protein
MDSDSWTPCRCSSRRCSLGPIRGRAERPNQPECAERSHGATGVREARISHARNQPPFVLLLLGAAAPGAPRALG